MNAEIQGRRGGVGGENHGEAAAIRADAKARAADKEQAAADRAEAIRTARETEDQAEGQTRTPQNSTLVAVVVAVSAAATLADWVAEEAVADIIVRA